MKALQLYVLQAGYCRHLACMADRGAGLKSMQFPALCGLIRHPDAGWILYDTGYASHFMTETARWPERLYRTALPVCLPDEAQLTVQLAGLGITPADIRRVIISHHHGDHIAGLKDFPAARFTALREASEHIISLRDHRWRATLGGHLPGLLPPDYLQRLDRADDRPVVPLPDWLAPLQRGFDLFGDGSMIAVPLPGHSKGQMGLFLPDANGRPALLAADACWSLPALRAGRLPAWPALALSGSYGRYAETFTSLRQLALRESALAILPSHCTTAWQEYQHAA
jgi:glyoxylase-like metal-dependent hydrolase (beta-lactamase superfamily II)